MSKVKKGRGRKGRAWKSGINISTHFENHGINKLSDIEKLEQKSSDTGCIIENFDLGNISNIEKHEQKSLDTDVIIESYGFDKISDIEKHEQKSSDSDLIPVIPIKDTVTPSKQLITADHAFAYDQRSEMILALRTELLMRHDPNTEGAYMMTLLSPGAGEGRSQLAAELAISFARLNQPTLLVDADFRNPRQHILFGAENTGGLSQVINSNVTPDLYGVLGLEHLLVMTTGEIPDNPMELLSGAKFAKAIEFFRENFDYVIFDTAPVNKYADGLVIANLIKNVITISRAKHTSYKSMKDMLRRLSATNANLLGGIINHF